MLQVTAAQWLIAPCYHSYGPYFGDVFSSPTLQYQFHIFVENYKSTSKCHFFIEVHWYEMVINRKIDSKIPLKNMDRLKNQISRCFLIANSKSKFMATNWLIGYCLWIQKLCCRWTESKRLVNKHLRRWKSKEIRY